MPKKHRGHLSEMFIIDDEIVNNACNASFELFSKTQNTVWRDLEEKYKSIYDFIGDIRTLNDTGLTECNVHTSVWNRFNKILERDTDR